MNRLGRKANDLKVKRNWSVKAATKSVGSKLKAKKLKNHVIWISSKTDFLTLLLELTAFEGPVTEAPVGADAGACKIFCSRIT